MTYYRVTYRLAGNAVTAYTEDFNEESGVLRFEDVEGRQHVVSGGTPYVVKECDQLPKDVAENAAESDSVTGVTTSDATAYDRPMRSEPADLGGGESTGVQDL